MMPIIIPIAISIIMLALASVSDIKSMRVPNYYTFPVMIIGLAYCVYLFGWKSALFRLAFMVACMLFHFLGILGGGDTKLAMAITAMNGPYAMLISIIYANIVLLLYYLIFHFKDTTASISNGLISLFGNNSVAVMQKREGKKVPFSLFLLIGFICYVVIKQIFGINILI